MRPKKNVKMQDIAEKLGISTVSVSKALSGQRGVSEEMRKKIEETAKEMGYVKVQSQAHSKKTRHVTAVLPDEDPAVSITIGVIVAARYLVKENSYYWTLYQNIAMAAAEKKCFTVIEVVSRDEEETNAMPRLSKDDHVKGIIMLGTFHQSYLRHVVDHLDVQVLSVDSPAKGICDSVITDNVVGGYEMTNYLFSLGHKKIGFVGTLLATSSIEDRFLGYVRSLIEHGIELDHNIVLDDRDIENGRVTMDPYFNLEDSEMPTAFFCNSDLTAKFLIAKLNERGYSVPDDISVAGYDNFVPGTTNDPGITTYQVDRRAMAERAVSIIRQKYVKPEIITGRVYVGGKLIIKGTTRKIDSPVDFV